jgi:hypothetical protein
MVMLIFDNEYVTCELDDEVPVLRHKWKYNVPGEEFKINLLKILDHDRELAGSHAHLAWLADTTLLGELDENVENWLVSSWEDLIFREGGIMIHAVILGQSIYADYPMEKFKMDAEQRFDSQGVRLGVFSSLSDAYAWMKSAR